MDTLGRNGFHMKKLFSGHVYFYLFMLFVILSEQSTCSFPTDIDTEIMEPLTCILIFYMQSCFQNMIFEEMFFDYFLDCYLIYMLLIVLIDPFQAF